jgi:hypothetical protein
MAVFAYAPIITALLSIYNKKRVQKHILIPFENGLTVSLLNNNKKFECAVLNNQDQLIPFPDCNEENIFENVDTKSFLRILLWAAER